MPGQGSLCTRDPNSWRAQLYRPERALWWGV